MMWDEIVKNYHEQHRRELNVDERVEAYNQTRVIKMVLESLPIEARRGITVQWRIVEGLKRLSQPFVVL